MLQHPDNGEANTAQTISGATTFQLHRLIHQAQISFSPLFIHKSHHHGAKRQTKKQDGKTKKCPKIKC
jgi:hypothetical protein